MGDSNRTASHSRSSKTNMQTIPILIDMMPMIIEMSLLITIISHLLLIGLITIGIDGIDISQMLMRGASVSCLMR